MFFIVAALNKIFWNPLKPEKEIHILFWIYIKIINKAHGLAQSGNKQDYQVVEGNQKAVNT